MKELSRTTLPQPVDAAGNTTTEPTTIYKFAAINGQKEFIIDFAKRAGKVAYLTPVSFKVSYENPHAPKIWAPIEFENGYLKLPIDGSDEVVSLDIRQMGKITKMGDMIMISAARYFINLSLHTSPEFDDEAEA